MLIVKNVSKKYGKLAANDNISMTVGDGELAVLIGPNGAGKSTLIKCVSGLLRYSGEVTIGGYPNKSVEAKSIFGYVPEMPAVYDLLTVSEHLEFIARAYGLENWEEYAGRLLRRFELDDKSGKLGKELSKGMQQKLSICCALLHRPSVLVLDEPLVGLDPHAIKQLKDIFLELRGEGRSLLISTHMLDSVEDYWDTAHIMVGGKIAASMLSSPGHDSGKSLEQLFFEVTEGGGAG